MESEESIIIVDDGHGTLTNYYNIYLIIFNAGYDINIPTLMISN